MSAPIPPSESTSGSAHSESMPAARPAKKALFSVSESAVRRIRELLAAKQEEEQPPVGIRVSVRKGGCSGLSYVIDYQRDAQNTDELVQYEELKIFIDPMAVMYLIGTEMDYIEEVLSSRFVFHNPNQKASCGCGESFSV